MAMRSKSNVKAFILACILSAAAFATALPFIAIAAQGEGPMTPVNVEVNSQVPISSDLERKLITVTEDVVRKSLPEVLARSTRADASASILEKSEQGYVVEVLVVSLSKQTFTAQLSRIKFTYKDDRVYNLMVEPYSQPK